MQPSAVGEDRLYRVTLGDEGESELGEGRETLNVEFPEGLAKYAKGA